MNIIALLLFICPVLAKPAVEEDIIRLQLTAINVGHEPVSQINAGQICIGTPCQNFTVMLDTGSSDLWVASTRCKSAICAKQHRFNDAKSSTYHWLNETFDIKYGTGDLEGILGEDNIKIGGIVVKKQKFGQATSSSETFAKAGLDGILGLAFKGVARGNTTPIFYSMVKQNAIKKPVFTFCKSSELVDNPVNEMILGGSDPSRYPGKQMTYVPVTGEAYWKFDLDKIVVGDEDVPLCADGCAAVADTGTHVVRGPRDMIDSINKLIGANFYKDTEYRVDCDTAKLPDVHFEIGGKNFTVTPEDYVLPRDTSTCVSGFAVTNSKSADFLILGGLFLDGKCTQFDLGKKQLGFVTIEEN